MPKNKQIILFMSDTTRKDMLGIYNSDMKTPNIDSLAKDGISFTNAYSCQPVCGPARSAIFTGQYPHTNGVVANSLAFSENIKTVGQRLRDAGVHAAYMGKYHLDGGDYFGYGECPDGWDPEYWFDQRNYLEGLANDEMRKKSREYGTSFADWLTEDFTFAHQTSNHALRFLDNNVDTDFFLTVSYDEPHGPCICPAPFNTMYNDYQMPDYPNFADDLEDKPLLQRIWAGGALHSSPEALRAPNGGRSVFLGCNSFMDYELGRVLKTINEKFPDAIVIYTSDHGDMMGSHKLFNKDSAAYKEIANIPFIVRGKIKGESDAMTSHIDLVPTILDYFEAPIPKTLQGKSMLPLLEGKTDEINQEVFTEWTRYEVDHDGFGGLQMMRAVTSKKYKLVINLTDKDEFYDLEKDPYEVTNLIDDPAYAKERNRLHDVLLDQMNTTRDPYRGYQWRNRLWRPMENITWEVDGYTRQREQEPGEKRQLDYNTGLPMEGSARRK